MGITNGMVVAGMGIFGMGMILGGVLAPLDVREAKIFQREEGKPAVLRLYCSPFHSYELMVQDSKDNRRFIPSSVHLSGIKDRADREVEEAEIKRAAEWYK